MMYIIPCVLLFILFLLLVVNIYFFMKDYSNKIKDSSIPHNYLVINSITLLLIIISIILTIYYLFIIYQQLH